MKSPNSRCLSLSLSLSLRFNGHIPGKPELAGFTGAKDDGDGLMVTTGFFPPVLLCQIWSFSDQIWHTVTQVGSRHSGQTIRFMHTIMEVRQKNLTPRLPPFKVIGTGTDRSATYDFLLVTH